MNNIGDELVFAGKATDQEEKNRLQHERVAQVDSEVEELRQIVPGFLPNVYRGMRLVLGRDLGEVDPYKCTVENWNS